MLLSAHMNVCCFYKFLTLALLVHAFLGTGGRQKWNRECKLHVLLRVA